MAQVKIDPKSKNWPYLEAGTYGPSGCTFEATCEVLAYECPALEGPAYDREAPEGKYAFIAVQVRRPNKPLVNIRHWEEIGPDTGSRMIQWLLNLKVPVTDKGEHDDKAPLGKKCIVECSEPRADKNNPDRKFTNLRNILAVS